MVRLFEAGDGNLAIRICIIIPAYNEEPTVGSTIEEYKAAFPDARLVVVDNNSSDRTSEVARAALDPATDLLLFEPRQGKGSAVKRGIGRLVADVYIMTDGDATYPASEAVKLVAELLRTRSDMLVGDRVSGGAYDRQNVRLGHGFGNRMLTKVISRLAGQPYNDVLSGLRIMSRPFVSMLDMRSSGFQLETELNVIAAYLRADVVERPIAYRQRGEGSRSKLSTLRDGSRILYFALTNWIAFAPMQAFSLYAAVATLVAAGLGYRVVAGFIESGWPYTTTAVAAAAAGISAALAIFNGFTLRILVRNDRRREIAHFLEARRTWNARLDADQV